MGQKVEQVGLLIKGSKGRLDAILAAGPQQVAVSSQQAGDPIFAAVFCIPNDGREQRTGFFGE